jgi:UDP-GlcNAc:undecaprenyl-phosphate/decaprenyl-phosphate GlcNAc-1-phosphate transferase
VYSILFLAAVSFICCLFLTPLVRRWSQWVGLLDRPNARKVHLSPTPRTGGIAIGLAYLAALGLLILSPLKGADVVDLPLATGLMPAAGVMFLVGLLDDLRGLRPWQKLLGQASAAVLAYAAGVNVSGVAGLTVPGWLTLPITIAWLVACSNAFNLIDGVDGLATGIGLFASFTTLAAALLQNHAPLALATAPLVGALVAFLRYNFNPASIFLGDCGSLTIGFLLGCFAAVWGQKSATLLGMTAPLMALAVPLLDTGASIVRRYLRRQPIFTADRNHLHHRLLDRGFSPRQVALVVYAICGIAAAFSLLMTVPHNTFHGLLLVTFCLTAWFGLRLAGYVEFDTARHLVLAGTFRHIVNARLFVDKFERKAARAVTRDDYWDIVRDAAEELGFPHVRMSLEGRVFEHHTRGGDVETCCVSRIPLSPSEYVNFKYPSGASVQHAVAMTSIVAILQRSITARAEQERFAGTGAVEMPPVPRPVERLEGVTSRLRPMRVARRAAGGLMNSVVSKASS